MKMLSLKLLATGSLGVLAGASTGSAWTVAMDNFESYQDGVALKNQVNHGGVGFAGDWIETFGLSFWVPLYRTSTNKVFNGTVTQNGYGVMTSGGRHMRTLAHPQSSGVVYASVLMIETVKGGGSSQFHLNSDTPLRTSGPGDIIGGVRYGGGVLQIIDTRYVHVPNDPATPEDESRNLEAIIPGQDGLTNDNPPRIAYNEFYPLAETYVDISARDTRLSTSVLWVMKYDMDASTISYYAFLPGDELTPQGASYSLPDHPVAQARKMPLGNISIAAFSEAVLYEFVKVGTTWKDVVPEYNNLAQAPMLRDRVSVDGVIDAEWDAIAAQDYSLKQGDGTQPASAADASGTWKAAWDADRLYLLFEVIDDQHFAGTDGRQDEIEFWTDANFARNHTDTNGPTTAYDSTDTQWITSFVDGLGTGRANRWQHASSELPANRKDITGLGDNSMLVAGVVENIASGVRKTVEVSISWADLAMAGPPAFGQLIGFETRLNDRDATTGNDFGSGNPLYASDGKLAWADAANRAAISPSTFGVLKFTPPVSPILNYNFSDLVVGQPAAGAGTDDNNWTGPWVEAWRISGNVANGAPANPFIGDLAQSGQGIVGVNAGRLSRTMDTVFASGVVWTSLVLGNGSASTQFWLGDSSKFDLNDAAGIAAGVRINSGSMQVINTTLNPSNKESYINVGVWPNAPVLVVIMLDYNTRSVGYWIFESGLPIDPLNPSAFYEFTLPGNQSLGSFSGVAWAGFNAGSVISSLRVGDQFSQVVPGARGQYTCPVLVNKLHAPVTLDGSVVDFAWERTNALKLTNFWSAGGTNVPPTSAADLSASFHTGWYGNQMYIAVLVDDEDVRNTVSAGSRDTVEIYLDGNNSDSQGIAGATNYDQIDDILLSFTLDASRADGADLSGTWFENTTGNPDGYRGLQGANPGQNFAGITWQASLTETGYVLEIALDMTVVPGLDTFLANKLMGLDLAVIDYDASGQVDGGGAPIIARSHVFFCADGALNGSGSSHFGTAYVAGAKPAIAMFGNGLDNVALTGDAAAGSGIYEVNTNFIDVTYAITANQSWATIDFDPGIGAGEVEFSWEKNTSLYQRAARIELSSVTRLNRINLTQAGVAPQAMQPFFPSATPGNSPGWASTYLGDVHYAGFPWVYAVSMQWLYAYEGSIWMHSNVIADFLHTSESIWPFLYTYGIGSQSQGWKYAIAVEGVGVYLYDYATGSYSAGPVFPQ